MKYLRNYGTLTGCVLLWLFSIALPLSGSAQDRTPMPSPKVIIFDVNETLLDLTPLKASVTAALSGREDLVGLWFSTMLHYSLVDTLTNDYNDFGQIGAAALVMVAESHNIELTLEQARQSIGETITRLPAHLDVVPALRTLKEEGYRLVSLTNSSNAGVEAQFAHAGLTEYFERRFSVEDVQAFKPDPRTYEWVLEELGIEPEEALMVAAHAWDLAGAKAVGLQTAYIQRPGTVMYPNTARPDYVAQDLTELIEQL